MIAVTDMLPALALLACWPCYSFGTEKPNRTEDQREDKRRGEMLETTSAASAFRETSSDRDHQTSIQHRNNSQGDQTNC